MEETSIQKKKLSNSTKFTILAVILIAVFSFALTPVTFQNDTYYTIKIGEHIQNYGVDMMDPFSWHEDLKYTYPHWLYDLITYWIYSAFDMGGIYVTTCILSCVLGISIYIVNSKINKNQVIAFFIAIGSMYLLRSYITARAQLVTFILFIWTVFFIEKYLETKKKRYGLFLVAISLAIANLHVAVWPFYFILFLPYIGEYIIANLGDFILYHKIGIWSKNRKIVKYTKLLNNAKDETLKQKYENKIAKYKEYVDTTVERVNKIKSKREEAKKEPFKILMEKNSAVKGLIIIMIISALMGLLTPLGDTPYTYLIKTMQGNTTQNINEHLPMTLINESDVICVFIIFLAILIFTKAKIKLCDLFMLGGLTYLMFASKRQVTVFVLMGGIILGRLLIDMFKRYNTETKNFVNVLIKPVGVFLTILIVLAASSYYAKPKLNAKYVDSNAYPVAACDFILNESGIDLEKARFYNEYNYGSYLLFRGIPVFIDSRADLYTPEFNPQSEDIFTDFINTSNIGVFYEDTFEKYNITHVLCYKDSKVNMIITKTNDPNYKQLYIDNNFVIYQRLNAKVQ